MITGLATATTAEAEQVMTLRELLRYCHVRCVRVQRIWFARGRRPTTPRQWIAARGATPIEAVEELLRRIGGVQ